MIKCTALLMAGCLFAGCTPPGGENQGDIRGWDFTACLDNLDTCPKLLRDNQEVILGGHTFVELLVLQLATGVFESGSFEEALLSALFPPPTEVPDPVKISSWDFSQCLESFDDFGVCSDLFFDNAGLIAGGQDFVGALVSGDFAPPVE